MTISLISKDGKEINVSKQPLSTQLLAEQNKTAALTEEITILKNKIVELEKSVEREKQNSTAHYNNTKKAEAEIEQIHQVLDAVPNSVARKSEGENTWDRTDRSALTRLAAWLTTRH